MTVALLLITDGRLEYLERTLSSANAHLPNFDQRVIVDDSRHELGFAGAIQQGWEQIATDWVFHLEADFTFHGNVPVAAMIELLDRHPHLAQVALKRQPWNDAEKAAGGIVELHPDDFTERSDDRATWTEHRRFFTTNPSVYSSDLCQLGWPQRKYSEGVFTHRLLRDPLLRFAFWGAKHARPLVEHIGDIRAGTGY